MSDKLFKALVRLYLKTNMLQGVNVLRDCISNEILLLKFTGECSIHFPEVTNEIADVGELTDKLYNDMVELVELEN